MARKLAQLTPVVRRMAYLLRHPEWFPLTSWDQFAELRDWSPEFHELTNAQIKRVFAYGVREWFLKPQWMGVGMTPWAGSARRQRQYCMGNRELIRVFLEWVTVLEEAEHGEQGNVGVGQEGGSG